MSYNTKMTYLIIRCGNTAYVLKKDSSEMQKQMWKRKCERREMGHLCNVQTEGTEWPSSVSAGLYMLTTTTTNVHTHTHARMHQSKMGNKSSDLEETGGLNQAKDEDEFESV